MLHSRLCCLARPGKGGTCRSLHRVQGVGILTNGLIRFDADIGEKIGGKEWKLGFCGVCQGSFYSYFWIRCIITV